MSCPPKPLERIYPPHSLYERRILLGIKYTLVRSFSFFKGKKK